MRHHLFSSIIAFWLLVGEAFALFCRSGSSGEVNELKSNSSGNNNEVEKHADILYFLVCRLTLMIEISGDHAAIACMDNF